MTLTLVLKWSQLPGIKCIAGVVHGPAYSGLYRQVVSIARLLCIAEVAYCGPSLQVVFKTCFTVRN